MSKYYRNMSRTIYHREWDRDYAVVKKIQKGRIIIEIVYNSSISSRDVVVKRDLTASEATKLLDSFK